MVAPISTKLVKINPTALPLFLQKNARNLGLPDVFVRLFSKNRISGIFIRKQRNLLGMFSDEGSRRNFP